MSIMWAPPITVLISEAWPGQSTNVSWSVSNAAAAQHIHTNVSNPPISKRALESLLLAFFEGRDVRRDGSGESGEAEVQRHAALPRLGVLVEAGSGEHRAQRSNCGVVCGCGWGHSSVHASLDVASWQPARTEASLARVHVPQHPDIYVANFRAEHIG